MSLSSPPGCRRRAPVRAASGRGARRHTTRHRAGGRALGVLAALLGALTLAGCRGEGPAAGPPPDPPSGPIRPDQPILFATLAQHLSFNTKSRMGLMALTGRVVQVRGPAWKVEPEGTGALLYLGTARGSHVRAYFADPADLKGVREGREVDLVGTFAFRGDHVLLEDARLGTDKDIAPRPAH